MAAFREQLAETQRDEPTALEKIGHRIRAAIERGDMTPEEGRERFAAARRRLAAEGEDDGDRLNKRGVIARAMATPTDEWSDGLKAAIVRAGWDLDEFTEGVRKRQQMARDASTPPSAALESQTDTDTAVEENSWGQVKATISSPR
jgi:sirohydrochlorin ferrochelatase